MNKFSPEWDGCLHMEADEAGDYYSVADVDARIAEHATAWKAQARRIAELEKALRSIADGVTSDGAAVIARKALGL